MVELNLEQIKELNLYEKMRLISDNIEKVGKGLSVGAGKSSYKAVSEGSVLKAVKPMEEKYRVYSYPSGRKVVSEDRLQWEETTVWDGKTTTKQKIQFVIRIETEYTFVNIDKPEERLVVVSYGDGIDTADKGSGKAQTYADKYAVMKAYKIATGEDPESTHSDKYQKPDKVKDTPKGNSKGQGKAKLLTDAQKNMIKGLCKPDERLKTAVLASCKVDKVEDIPLSKASEAIKWLQDKSATWLKNQK